MVNFYCIANQEVYAVAFSSKISKLTLPHIICMFELDIHPEAVLLVHQSTSPGHSLLPLTYAFVDGGVSIAIQYNLALSKKSS